VVRKTIGSALIALSLATGARLLTDAQGAEVSARLPVPIAGFKIAVVARIPQARELAAAPNGDLFVGTAGSDVYLVRRAEATPLPPRIFATFGDDEAAGVALAHGSLFVGTEHAVWRLPYRDGQQISTGRPQRLASVRTRGGDDHVTTTVAVTGETLYASVGSSCNICAETDPTRATVQQMTLAGRNMHAKAVHIRNAIALATNPATGALWAGVAGQDELPAGHPYEIFDPLTLHAETPDYGWPTCFEDRRAALPGAECSKMTVARVVMPAYATPTGAAFYPARPTGRYAFPQRYRGGAFVAWHGSWHMPPVPPRIVFIPLRGDEPLRPVRWSDPRTQWSVFLDGFQVAGYGRIGRPTGVAVGPQGSLFVADDLAGVVYRIRPEASVP